MVRKFGKEVGAQVSSSSSDHGSKLRGPSQNSPRAAAKRDVNITKLTRVRPYVCAMQCVLTVHNYVYSNKMCYSGYNSLPSPFMAGGATRAIRVFPMMPLSLLLLCTCLLLLFSV
ncbi:hypothetical protein AVEN_123936-1 [Araneus ventricosus]|uniref:Uncharacterized protein n=1 Tax=Araneus ventricosus TaxID=182803 RepID=A0A4Y2TBM3_ARAVE|nr:hypothetical protein AVEN_39163-1 [Araneus ventricosus]GBN96806.1 hypothetical protein AVEN_123936-1 [Araneus ventricosus]